MSPCEWCGRRIDWAGDGHARGCGKVKEAPAEPVPPTERPGVAEPVLDPARGEG